MRDLPGLPGAPVARCPANGVEAYAYPFFVAPARAGAPNFLLLPVHLWEMEAEEKAVLGELVEVRCAEDLERMGFPRDDLGIFVVGG
jgi:hypothetical protein